VLLTARAPHNPSATLKSAASSTDRHLNRCLQITIKGGIAQGASEEKMEERTFRAVNISAQDSRGRSTLVDAFNEWAENERPASIIHVYYFHDQSAHTRGYLIIYETQSAAARQRKAA